MSLMHLWRARFVVRLNYGEGYSETEKAGYFISEGGSIDCVEIFLEGVA